MARTQRYRLRFPFWLDMQKPAERELADQIELLKNERTFAATVRNGIRLMIDLRAGRLDVLLELFPWIGERLSVNGSGQNSDGELRRELQRLQELIMSSNGLAAPPSNYPTMKPSGLAPIAGAGRIPTLPTLDDDDDDGATLVLKRDTSTSAGQNFLNSLMSLQQ